MAFDLAPEAGDKDDLPEDKAPEEVAATEPVAPVADGPGAVVSLAPKLSRRAQAAEEQKQVLAALTSKIDTLASGISQRDQELAHMRGMMEAQAQQPRYVAPPQQHQAGPDPETLIKEGKAALIAGDHDTYLAKTMQATRLQTIREIAPAFQELQQRAQQPNQMPPEMAAMFAAHPDVAMAPNSIELLQAKNMELNARRVPPGPERLRMVFSEVDAIVKAGKKGGGAQYSQASAAALSGVPTSSRSGGGGSTEGPGVALTAAELAVAIKLEKSGVMSRADYAKGIAEQDPSRISR
jgi:hypothetical protein